MTQRLSNLLIVACTCHFCLTSAAGPAAANDYFVDQKHADASDNNPGTKAKPLMTIQAGLDKAQPGDTVLVRGGVYHESVKFKRGGAYNGASIEPWSPQGLKWLTLEAYQDEHVVLDGAATIPADKWQRAADRKCVYWTPLAGEEQESNRINMVFRDGTMIMPTLANVPGKNSSLIEGAPCSLVPAMPGDKPADEGYYYDHPQKRLYVNLGGRMPGKGAEVRAVRLPYGIDAAGTSFVRVRKFEVRNCIGAGIGVYNAHEFLVEDNHIHHCGNGMWGGPSSTGFIRHNTIADIMKVGMGLGGARGTIVEENVVKRSHLNPYKVLAWDGSAIICNSSFGFILRNNVVADCADAGGVWPDCGGLGLGFYGNTVYNVNACGFYIEASVTGATLRWNCAFNNGAGIVFRQNWANTAFENYTFHNRREGLAIGSCDQDGLPKANAMMYNWVIDNGTGSTFGPDRLKEPAHTFDHNVYKVPAGGVILQFGSKQFKDLATLRAETGEEMHGQVVKQFDPAPLGLVTFRVHDTQESWKPVPMFGNPNTERNDVLNGTETDPYFWKKGSFRGDEPFGWHSVDCSYCTISRDDDSGFVRQLRVPGMFAIPASWQQGVDDKSAARPGNVACLQISSVRAKTISAAGYGYWGVSLPTTDGAEIDLSLWIRARQVKAAGPNGGLYVAAEFCDDTGQNVTRQYLVGGEDGQKAAGGDWMTGDYLYKQLTGLVTAPKGARWFKLGFGLKSCTGWVALNDIDIKTRPGAAVAEASKTLPIDPRQFSWTPCDLAGLLNRPLADDIDNDGKGGWTDQGPTMDLRNLHAGDYTWNDVAFRVPKGNACFIMKNKYRPSQDLPAGGKVELNGKADVLALLHSGAWLEPDVRQATYVIHYADGGKVEIPVVGGKNILDWTTPAIRAGELKYDPALGLLLPATSVASPQFVHVTVWMLLWKNPHPDKRIVAFEVKGANQGIPGLLGVSAGRAK